MPLSPSIIDYTGGIITTNNHPQSTTLAKHFLFGTSPDMHYVPSVKKLDPFNRQSYIMSAVDMLRHQYDSSEGIDQQQQYPSLPIEDHYSLSSLDSSNSSVSGTISPSSLPQHQQSKARSKKQSYTRLLREIRRLRSENTNLHNSVNILREDLRHERESRQIAEQVHRKYYEVSIDQHTQLELEILDQQEEIAGLRTRLDSTTTTNSTDPSVDSYRSPLLFFGVDDTNNDETPLEEHHDDDDDDDDDNDITTSIYQLTNNNDEQDQDEDKYEGIDDQFEDLAVSYLRQALVSNLTSARANLEFDDLMLKYDPSPDRVLRTLADAFLGWLCDTIHSNTTVSHQDKSTCVAQLMATRVQDVFLRFWKAILERYVHNDEDQYQFLHQTECSIQHHSNIDENTAICQDIVQNFHRLLVMLYKYDIVDSDAVTTWWHTLPSSLLLSDSTDQQRRQDCVTDQLRDVTRKFVEWVDEEDDDDEECDENGNNDDEDEDETACVSDCDLDNIDADDPLFTPTPSPIRSEKPKKSVTIQL